MSTSSAEKSPTSLESKLISQYDSQIALLEGAGILQRNGSMTDIEGKAQLVPGGREIAKRFEKNKDFLTKKYEQGFTKLLIVPQKASLNTLIDAHGSAIGRHRTAGKLLDSNGKKITGEPHEDKNVWAWDEYKNADTDGRLVYFPDSFSKNHGGIAKKEISEAFQILLTEDFSNLLREGKGKKLAGRTQFETNKTPEDYLETLKYDRRHEGEFGFTPEAAIIDAITRLEETNTVTDYETASYHLGAYFPNAGDVPRSFWDPVVRQAGLGRFHPGDRGGDSGPRVAVRV